MHFVVDVTIPTDIGPLVVGGLDLAIACEPALDHELRRDPRNAPLERKGVAGSDVDLPFVIPTRGCVEELARHQVETTDMPGEHDRLDHDVTDAEGLILGPRPSVRNEAKKSVF